MAVPYTFAAQTGSIPLSQLDSNFSTAITLGNTAVVLGNTYSTLGNLTLSNVTISSGNVAINVSNVSTVNTVNLVVTANASVSGNVTITGNATAASINSATAYHTTSVNAAAANVTILAVNANAAILGNVSVGLTANIATLNTANVVITSTTSANLSSNATVDGTNSVGYLTIPQDAQTGNYTLVAADSGKHIYHALGAAAATYTIPANSSVSYATGTAVSFVNLSGNAVTIAITTDTMYLAGSGSTGSRTLTQYGIATAIKLAGTSWIISGSNLT
jgi:hypothetical protein